MSTVRRRAIAVNYRHISLERQRVDNTTAAKKKQSSSIRTVLCKGRGNGKREKGIRKGERGKGEIDVGMNPHLSIVVYTLGAYDIVLKKNKRIIMEDLKLK
jgi:hypothetical protein